MEGESKGEFIMDPEIAKLEPNEEFHHHTGDEWDKIASKETKPTEHKLGLEKEPKPVDPETGRKLIKAIIAKLESGERNRLPKREVPPHDEPVNAADAQAQWERENGK